MATRSCLLHPVFSIKQLDDLDLLQASISGDQNAFNTLLDRHKDRVYRTALGLMGNHEEAEELAQDVFVTLYQKGHQFRGESALSSWLYRITHNLGKNRLLRRKIKYISSLEWVTDAIPHFISQPDSSQTLEHQDGLEQVLNILKKMDYGARHLLILREIHGLSYEEISESTGLPMGTVKSKLSRAKEKARRLLLAAQPEGVSYV